MPRNFGVRGHDRFRDFWNGPTPDNEREAVWPYYLIGAAVLAMIVIGIFA